MSLVGLSTFSRTAFAVEHLLFDICLSISEWAPLASHVESGVGGDKKQLTRAGTVTTLSLTSSVSIQKPLHTTVCACKQENLQTFACLQNQMVSVWGSRVFGPKLSLLCLPHTSGRFKPD